MLLIPKIKTQPKIHSFQTIPAHFTFDKSINNLASRSQQRP